MALVREGPRAMRPEALTGPAGFDFFRGKKLESVLIGYFDLDPALLNFWPMLRMEIK